MLQGSKILSMGANPDIIIHGIDKIIKKDLEKHKVLLERSKLEVLAYRKATAHEIKKKKYYKSLIGGEKYNDDSLKKSMDIINVNIRHLSDGVKTSNDATEHHALIVDTLSEQLKDYYARIDANSRRSSQ